MRRSPTILMMLLTSLPCPTSELAQTAPAPARHQALTPEQALDKQRIDAFLATRTKLIAAAKHALQSELTREKTDACRHANSTYEAVTCLSAQEKLTNANYTAMAANLRALLALKSPYADEPPNPGPAGVPLTAAQQAAEFDRLEQGWKAYRAIANRVAFDQFQGGTEASVSGAMAALMLARSHMKELASLYDFQLRNH